VTNGEETHIDVPFKELANRARGGFQIYFEARQNKFFLAFDGTWATLGETIEGRCSWVSAVGCRRKSL